MAAKLNVAAGRQPIAAPVPVQTNGKKTPPITVFIGGQWPPEVRRALKLVEAHSGKRLKPLLSDAINYICVKYGVPEPCTVEE